jgi:hypothetical protein
MEKQKALEISIVNASSGSLDYGHTHWSRDMTSMRTDYRRICKVFAEVLYETFSNVIIGLQLLSVLEPYLYEGG